jgi:tRNA (cmo5U34)-methyltransferase
VVSSRESAGGRPRHGEWRRRSDVARPSPGRRFDRQRATRRTSPVPPRPAIAPGGDDSMNKDKIFAQKTQAVADFNFGESTAQVFEDMLDRSIPLYREVQRMMGELAAEFAVSGTNVYDLGCSNGITLETLDTAIRAADKRVHLVGIDYSRPMLEKAAQRFAARGRGEAPEFVFGDLNEGCRIENASVVVLNLTLQFVRPLFRDRLVRSIREGLNPNGCLILIEKVLGNDSLFNRLFIKFYYDLKRRNDYSDMEIAQKREALENVLIPYRIDENVELLKRNGFASVDVFYKWYNFAGLVGVVTEQ